MKAKPHFFQPGTLISHKTKSATVSVVRVCKDTGHESAGTCTTSKAVLKFAGRTGFNWSEWEGGVNICREWHSYDNKFRVKGRRKAQKRDLDNTTCCLHAQFFQSCPNYIQILTHFVLFQFTWQGACGRSSSVRQTPSAHCWREASLQMKSEMISLRTYQQRVCSSQVQW